MGAKCTVDINKNVALNKIYEFLSDASNEAISDILEVLNDDARDNGREYIGLYNFRVND